MRILSLTLLLAVSASAQEKTPAVSAPQKTPAVSAPQKTPAVSAQQKTPVVSAQEKTPAVGAQEKTPAVSAQQKTPAVSAQEKTPAAGQLPTQGPPPTNLTKLPDGHFSANTDPKNVENFEIRVVVAGDTLSGIANEVLKDGRLWPQIWEQNEHIVNPHWIYPKDKILIRPVTRITEARPPDQTPAPEAAPAAAAAPPAEEPPQVKQPPRPFIVPPYPVTEPPRGPSVILDLTPPKVYPEVKSADLYCSGFIRTTDVSRDIKVVARYANDEVMANVGNYVYLDKGAADGVIPGLTYEVIRPTRHISGLGTHYLEIGQLEVVMGQNDFALARVSQGCEAVELGDFVIPYNKPDFPALPANRPFSGTMKPSGQIPAKIVSSKTALMNSGSKFGNSTRVPGVPTGSLSKLNRGVVGEQNVVYIDVGKDDGVKAGDLFIVFRDVVTINGSTLRDKNTNEIARTAVGEIVVLKVEDRASTALVTYATDVISLEDSVEKR